MKQLNKERERSKSYLILSNIFQLLVENLYVYMVLVCTKYFSFRS